MLLLLTIKAATNFPEISIMLANKIHCFTVHRQFNQNDSVNARKSFRRRRLGELKD